MSDATEFESEPDEIERDPWDERDAFLAAHEGEDIQAEVHVVVPEEVGEDPL